MEIDVEILGSIIEFSVGLAGFAGIVAVFLNRASVFLSVRPGDSCRIRCKRKLEKGPLVAVLRQTEHV